jgi:hypothetical protein
MSDYCVTLVAQEAAMTDGPFKNLKLGVRWKRFAEAVQNDAMDATKRCGLASDALVREILSDDNSDLLAALQRHVGQRQLDIDPGSSVESIFGSHRKTPFADSLQREMAFRLGKGASLELAMGQALQASLSDQISVAKNRIEEECIRAREAGEMRQTQFDCVISQAKKAFEALDKETICDALRAGSKDAFKGAASKKEDIDEGPNL